MNNISPTGFYLDENPGHQHDKKLLSVLIEHFEKFGAKTILDLGCGNGFYTKALISSGFNCRGYDGNPNIKTITNNLCSELDLSQPMPNDISADWSMSLEVGEHIPKIYEETFMLNVCKSAKIGVVLSWATPGQGGRGHFNERTNEYITEKVAKHSFRRDLDSENKLRSSASFSWFRKTLMVFVKV